MSYPNGELQVFDGDDARFVFTIKTQAGAREDVSGWAFEVHLQNEADPSDTLTLSAYTVTSAAQGEGYVTFAAADTTGRAGNRYAGRLRRTGTGTRTTLADFVVQVLE